jgi:glycerophosphoryl diester phosphodiesterase
MAAYHLALRSKVDCLEIDVSRSKDGVLFALHDRYIRIIIIIIIIIIYLSSLFKNLNNH